METLHFRKRILVADDDPKIRKFLVANLKALGYEVIVAVDGDHCLKQFEKFCPDLMLLDIMMPKIDGLTVLKHIRAISSVPVLLLTAKGETEDKVIGLNSGADDYLPKPFALEELFARINALLRRQGSYGNQVNSARTSELAIGPLRLNTIQRRVWVENSDVHLTANEFKVLALLMRHSESVLSHEFILQSVWGDKTMSEVHYVRIIIARIRQKIKDAGFQGEFIRSVSGVGYICCKP